MHSFVEGRNGWFFLWFVVITLVVLLLLAGFKPNFVQVKDRNGEPTGRFDYLTALLTALIVAVIICFLGCLCYCGLGRRYY